MKFGIGSINRKTHQSIVALFLTLSLMAVGVNAQTEGAKKAAKANQDQPKDAATGTTGKAGDSSQSESDSFFKDKKLHDQARAYVQEFVGIDISVLAPQNVSDIFGRHLAHRYVVLQVTIKNDNPKFRFLIQDIKLRLDGIYVDPLLIPKVRIGNYHPSSNDLSLVQGVAERGQNYDRRNFALRLLRGAGSIAAGLIGVTTFGSSYAPSVAVFNGPVISAFANVFPDSTINQLIRLNDRAYRANTLVPAQQSVVIAIFLDSAMLLPGKDLRAKFFDDPLSIQDRIDFRGAVALLNGTFITEAFEESLSVTQSSISEEQRLHFQDPKPEVIGTISGHGLTGALLDLDSPKGKGIKVELTQTSEATKMEFKITSDKPVEPGTPLLLVVTKGHEVAHTSPPTGYTVTAPTLAHIDPSQGKVGERVSLVLTGDGFSGFSEIKLDSTEVTAQITDVKSTTIKADFTISADAKPGPVSVQVRSRNVAETLPQVFTVKEAEKEEGSAATEKNPANKKPKNKAKKASKSPGK